MKANVARERENLPLAVPEVVAVDVKQSGNVMPVAGQFLGEFPDDEDPLPAP